jgi:hypothetical protein
MAPLARAPERAMMCVISTVAGIAILRQDDFGDVFRGVTGVAQQALVGAGERILRLSVVIEAPPRPAVRVVAKRTVGPQAPFMMLVLMAARASARDTLEQHRTMALFARDHCVAADQRKSGEIVVERDLLTPAGLAMALLATVAELPSVRIVFPVAGHTVCRELVAIESAGMATVALDLGVRAAKRILGCLVVIEMNRPPFVLVVTGLALRSVPSRMNILDPMAFGAGRADVSVALTSVAHRTRHGRVCALESEPGLVVVERFGVTPSLLIMTIVARFAQPPLMWIARLVTVEAATGSAAKPRRLPMAAVTLNRLVSAVQSEIRHGVVERLPIELNNVGFPSFVIGVTVVAFLPCGFRLAAMETRTELAIRRDVLVTCDAKPRLRAPRERLVAIAAVRLKLGMPADQRSRHHESLE